MDFTADLFLKHSPHNVALGIKLVRQEKGIVILELPYQEKLVGDPETGVIAGGAVTSVLDTACGFATYSQLGEFRAISTLDLRIDYLRPATPHKSVFARAECYRVTRHLAFIRATARHDVHDHEHQDQVIANASAVFSLTAFSMAELAAKKAQEAGQ